MREAAWRQRLGAFGFNLQAWISARDVRDPEGLLAPEIRSLWLIGSAGRGLWQAYQQHLLEDPSWRERPDPLDEYTRWHLESLRGEWEQVWGKIELLYPFGWTPQLDFVQLASLAGWGSPGPLGMAIHPRFGPWFALRAAVLTTHLPASYARPLPEPMCLHCEAPCVEACPPAAVQRAGWKYDACAGYRLAGSDCQEICHARLACPIGAEERYPEAQMAYHMHHALDTMKTR